MHDCFLDLLESPVGLLRLRGDDNGLCGISLCSTRDCVEDFRRNPILTQAKRELLEYFQGRRKEFSVPLSLNGTEFQLKVWSQLQRIPYGQTCSYGELAMNMGHPKAARAVGQANHNNPIMIMVPCHRVIGKNHKLGGYAGGLHIKKYLLELEGRDQ